MSSAEYQKVNAATSTGEHVSGESVLGGSPPSHAKSGGESWIARHFPFLKTKRGIAITVAIILLTIGGGLAGLAALPKKGNKNANGAGDGDGDLGDSITSDEHFYGQSPPVYPSRTSACLSRLVWYTGSLLKTKANLAHSKHDRYWRLGNVIEEGQGYGWENDT